MTDHETYHQLRALGLTPDQVRTLQRCANTLHRWAEQECGHSNDYASWAIERDEETEIPYLAIYPHDAPATRKRIPDREAGALKRVARICQEHGALHCYHQTDPRGAALYLSTEPLDRQTYTRGIAL